MDHAVHDHVPETKAGIAGPGPATAEAVGAYDALMRAFDAFKDSNDERLSVSPTRSMCAIGSAGQSKRKSPKNPLGLGSFGKVLTVLVSSKIGQEDDPDEEDDDDLIERWTPRFRR
jgi:hypothetical protein